MAGCRGASCSSPRSALASQGFEISPRLHFLLDGFKRFARGEEFRAHFYDESGEPWPTGHRLINEEYAATLRAARRAGQRARCTRASSRRRSSREVRENSVRPGRMTLDDLQRLLRARVRAALQPVSRMAGLRSAAAIVGRRHGAADTRHAADVRPRRELATIRSHAIHLSPKRAGSRSQTGICISATRASSTRRSKACLSRNYLRDRAGLIDAANGDAQRRGRPRRRPLSRGTSRRAHCRAERASTSHFSIIDDGDAVAMTTSVQSTFGSQLMVGGSS